MTGVRDILDDLEAEGDELSALVAPLDAAGWSAPTPAAGWTVAHQVAHLAWTDDLAVLAATDPDGFTQALRSALAEPSTFIDTAAAEGAAQEPAHLLARWEEGRRRVRDVLAEVPRGTRLPWIGTAMSAASMATARLMETWAHGLDVAHALGSAPRPTARLRHVAHLGVRTRDFAFAVHEIEAPDEEFRVTLVAPGGETWTWGPQDAAQQVSGAALDFCLLVTQRRHRADLALDATGPDADRWLDIAQTFAGPPGAGRRPGEAR